MSNWKRHGTSHDHHTSHNPGIKNQESRTHPVQINKPPEFLCFLLVQKMTSPALTPRKRRLSDPQKTPSEPSKRAPYNEPSLYTRQGLPPFTLPNDHSVSRSRAPSLTLDSTALSIQLAKKEEEVHTLLSELHSLAQPLNPDAESLKKKFLDPAVNALFRAMRKEIEDKDATITDLRDELEGVTFTPNSITGKKLIAKCKALRLENEELGRQLRQGRVEQYEVELALQRRLIEELKSGMSGTYCYSRI
ncbi:hypothetical protein BC937DRAFT_86653 [Endogone sp. FLAS-F59071]|nr:hypothetical protein BC937DRAFT_86653 [Endogone sp. FLAS-F59071]|eukprot:RUS19963.1 hypothetical protein BC937DRAFT_86653 [Endogone sp. FLAS-F59071]